ncbi:MAG: hypothetical protein K8M05_19610 [Deltaproteobacteria bacterium]|nr:hypothetical protein [Kofleriaceae bacterium]
MFTLARELAASSPDAKLPCPVCASTLAARNLEAHLAKVHGSDNGGGGGGPWRGRRWAIFPATLHHHDGSIVLRTLLGRRAVKLPCSVEVGTLVGVRPAAGMASYADDYNVPHDTVRTGAYLRLGDAITVGCRGGANVKAHWAGWTQGPRRRRADLIVDRRARVELEYVLAAAGALRPA